MLDSPSSPGVAEAKHDDGITTSPSPTLRPPEPTGRSQAPANPSILRAYLPTLDNIDGVAEVKTDESRTYLAEAPPLPRAVDGPPELPRTCLATGSNELAGSSAPMQFDCEGPFASQIKELQAALQGSMNATLHGMDQKMSATVLEAMHETHQIHQSRAESLEAKIDARAESLEAKIDAFMGSVGERLEAIERQVLSDRQHREAK